MDTKETSSATPVDPLVITTERYHSRNDLCALAVLERVSRFKDDELERIDAGHHERYVAGMRAMRGSVDELIRDIIREPEAV